MECDDLDGVVKILELIIIKEFPLGHLFMWGPRANGWAAAGSEADLVILGVHPSETLSDDAVSQ